MPLVDDAIPKFHDAILDGASNPATQFRNFPISRGGIVISNDVISIAFRDVFALSTHYVDYLLAVFARIAVYGS